jgi:tetratricopeptide (TPR) repeat protein
VQIETAFITIPGHIFMAFALDASEDEARTTFSQTDELIFTEGKVWVPVEVTEREGSFMTAWQEGAKEWRENVLKKQAEFWPVRDAWKTYEAVFFPGTGSQPELPKAAKVLSDFQDDVSRLVTREMFDREAALKAAVAKSGGSAKSVNALGVLYARFDQQDKAEAQFQKILAKSEFVPTLVNMGNLSYLRGDFKKALTYYNRAYKQAPTDATVVLAVARANQELQNYGTVKETFDALKKLDPALASRFAYLDLQGEQSTRAAEVSRVKNVVVWEEVK